MKLTLICGCFLLLGMLWGWGLAKMGKGEMPEVDCIRPGDDEWIEKEYFNVSCSDEGIREVQ